MAQVNFKRLTIGIVAGTIVWSLWTSMVTMGVLLPVYGKEQQLGHMLMIPRFGAGLFFSEWFLMLLAVIAVGAGFYARFHPLFGSRLKAAAVIGGSLGFLVAIPINLSVITWSAMAPAIPLGWALDAWVGVMLAIGAVALFYRDPPR